MGYTNKIIIRTVLIIYGMFLYSCTRQNDQAPPNSFNPKVVEAKGYIVPKDSIALPISKTGGNPAIVKAGNPKLLPADTNIFPAGEPKIVTAGIPKIYTPGKDTFSRPKVFLAIDSSFAAGIPEAVIAKDAHINDNNPQNFSTFSKLQGLKSGYISCMLQDKKGNIWFGTKTGGVSKYDGKSFTNFTVKEGLSNNYIWSMLEDKIGNIWIGTGAGGVCRYDGKFFTNFTKKEGFNNPVVSMLEDKNGNIWFGTNGEGIFKYDGNRVDAILGRDKTAQGTLQDLKKTNGKLVKTFTHFTYKEGLSSNTIWCMLEDKSGNIWCGTHGGGASRYDGKSFAHFGYAEGFSNNNIKNMFEDAVGNIWFGIDGEGICKYDRDDEQQALRAPSPCLPSDGLAGC